MKSAKVLFGDTDKKIEVVSELPDNIKNLLIAGAMIVKHSNNAAPRQRHVYITPDLKFLVWKDPKKPLHPDNKMKVIRIRTIERGRCTPQLERKRSVKGNTHTHTSKRASSHCCCAHCFPCLCLLLFLSFGKFLAKEECAWAIIGRDRTVDLESLSESEREKWIHAIEMLVAYRKELKRVATQFHL